MLAFSQHMCYYTVALRRASKYPGVAKFGIALEWGSRGLEFESRHSDQKSRNSIYCFCFFLYVEIRTSVATLRWSVAREGLTERNNNFCHRQKCNRISTLGIIGRRIAFATGKNANESRHWDYLLINQSEQIILKNNIIFPKKLLAFYIFSCYNISV